jgi:hypothetical protein
MRLTSAALFREVTSVRHGRGFARDDFFDAAEVTKGHLSSGRPVLQKSAKAIYWPKIRKSDFTGPKTAIPRSCDEAKVK